MRPAAKWVSETQASGWAWETFLPDQGQDFLEESKEGASNCLELELSIMSRPAELWWMLVLNNQIVFNDLYSLNSFHVWIFVYVLCVCTEAGNWKPWRDMLPLEMLCRTQRPVNWQQWYGVEKPPKGASKGSSGIIWKTKLLKKKLFVKEKIIHDIW